MDHEHIVIDGPAPLEQVVMVPALIHLAGHAEQLESYSRVVESRAAPLRTCRAQAAQLLAESVLNRPHGRRLTRVGAFVVAVRHLVKRLA